MELEPYQPAHLDGVLKICRDEGWTSYTSDPERTHRVLTAPGVTTIVAVDQEEVCGFVQLQSDGEIQAHLSLLAVQKNRRREGIGQKLITFGLAQSGGIRMDLITDDAQNFYQAMKHSSKFGFRLYPETE
jgi:ribosomal protein S18 acetylase RimI-like enzyme